MTNTAHKSPPDSARSAPDISVVVACYNAAETVNDTLASLRAQTHANWEAVCVDDGSRDATGRLLEDAAREDRRLRVIRLPRSGQPAAKNAGLDAATGRFVMILDADDVARPDALATLLRVADLSGGTAIVAPSYELLSEHGVPLGIVRRPNASDFDVDRLLHGNRMPPMSLIPRDVLAGWRFDETLKTSIDWDLWLRLADAGARCVATPSVLFGYRLHHGSLSHNADGLFASGQRVLERWTPYARDPRSTNGACHRLAGVYGALALAYGDPTAVNRYFDVLPPTPKGESLGSSIAGSLHWAFEFVHGAEGQLWRDRQDEWLATIDVWLEQPTLRPWRDEIRHALRSQLACTTIDPQIVLEAARRCGARRLVIYGMGANGVALFDALRASTPSADIEIAIADDHIDPQLLQLHGAPLATPKTWRRWEEGTFVIVTPTHAESLTRRLVDVGGRLGDTVATLASLVTARPCAGVA